MAGSLGPHGGGSLWAFEGYVVWR